MTDPDDLVPGHIDRPRGVLNERQRRWLVGESEIESRSSNERNVRHAIRQNLTNAILDFTLIVRHLEERDRELIFDREEAGTQRVSSSLADLVAFVYQESDQPTQMEQTVRSGIKRALTAEGLDANVEVAIDVNDVVDLAAFPDDLEERLDDFSMERLVRYHISGHIDQDRLGELIIQKQKLLE